MFKIDAEKNRISPLETKQFSELGFGERKHLQEWIANYPEVLGEELLIIQKEFDGFDETRERLDLLALDKQGNLAIIENKLDDSGRDVVWQALKYAGYCANLSKNQIVEIFQRHLQQSATTDDGNAIEIISDFLGKGDFDELILNSGQSQRIFFVAANYRKEVTNTVLWLIGHGIDCRCFRATPYASGNDFFLNFDQVIPTPEAADYMIRIANKEAEEKQTSKTVKGTQELRESFWVQTLESFRQSECDMFNNRSPSKECWVYTGSGILSGLNYTLVVLKKEVRVEFNMETSDQKLNAQIFDKLQQQRNEIETQFGDKLLWYLLPNRKACRIKYRMEINGHDDSNWPEIQQWFIKHVSKLELVVRDYVKTICDDLLH